MLLKSLEFVFIEIHGILFVIMKLNRYKIKYYNFRRVILTVTVIFTILVLYRPYYTYGKSYDGEVALYSKKARQAEAAGDIKEAVSYYKQTALIYENKGEVKKSAFYWMKVYLLDNEGYDAEEAKKRLEDLDLIDSDRDTEILYKVDSNYTDDHRVISFDREAIDHLEQERKKGIEALLNNIEIELALDYQRIDGEQLFTVLTSQGARLSQLTYPIDGDMITLRGEVRFHPKFSFGINYGSSNFKENTCSDEDWNFLGVHNFEIKTIEYQITEQNCKSEMEIFDINLYWNFLNLKHGSEEKSYNSADNASFDLFVGYHQQKGRYTMKDPMTQYLRVVDDVLWQAIGLPLYQGLDSPYKVKYSGPQLGIRLKGEKGKLSTVMSAGYAWIKTTAHGWWNLRSYSFTQKSTNLGHALMYDVNTRYDFYEDWYLGLGYRCIEYTQEKLKESGAQPGDAYNDLDIIRDVNNKIYGPYFTIGLIW